MRQHEDHRDARAGVEQRRSHPRADRRRRRRLPPELLARHARDARARPSTASARAAERPGAASRMLQDLSGPKIRTGALRGGAAARRSHAGDELRDRRRRLRRRPGPRLDDATPTCRRPCVRGDTLLLDDGHIQLRVEGTRRPTSCDTVVVDGGLLGEHKGINAPGVRAAVGGLTREGRRGSRVRRRAPASTSWR